MVFIGWDKYYGTKMFTPSSNEYNSFRQELITRITLINNQAHTAILTILLVWSAGFVLLAKIPELDKNLVKSVVIWQ